MFRLLSLPGWAVVANVITATVNVCAYEVSFLAPHTKYGLDYRRAVCATLAMFAFIFLTIAFLVPHDPTGPATLRFADDLTFAIVLVIYLGTLYHNYLALFVHKWPLARAPGLRGHRLSGVVNSDDDAAEDFEPDPMEMSILYLTTIYNYPSADRLRRVKCQCAPCFPIDNLETHLEQLSVSGGDDDKKKEAAAHDYINNYIEQLESDHEIYAIHASGCAATGFSEAAQNRLADHLDGAKKRV